jgi:predicted ABC-class ATPase
LAAHGSFVEQILGDGREVVATDPLAVKIRAEDGRRVEGVDITPFINNLPFGVYPPPSCNACVRVDVS